MVLKELKEIIFQQRQQRGLIKFYERTIGNGFGLFNQGLNFIKLCVTCWKVSYFTMIFPCSMLSSFRKASYMYMPFGRLCTVYFSFSLISAWYSMVPSRSKM